MITEAIDEAAEHTESTEMYLTLTGLRAELTEAVPADGLPELVTREVRSPKPSLVIAYEVYGDALKESGVDAVSSPFDFDVVTIGKDGVEFTVKVSSKPEIKLGDYKGIEA